MVYYENREYSTDFPIQATLFDNFMFRAHWHTEYEITLVCKGTVSVGVNSETCELSEGDMIICTGGDVHYYDSTSQGSSVLVVVFRPELIEDALPSPMNVRFATPFIVRGGHAPPPWQKELADSLFDIFDELQAQKKQYKLIVRSKLIWIYGTLLRHLPATSNIAARTDAHGRGIALVQRAINFIEKRYSDNIGLPDVSKHLKISPTYCSRIFKQITGQGVISYLNAVRVERADILLKSSSEPVIAIAYECGFNSVRTFNRVYKALYGAPPSSQR